MKQLFISTLILLLASFTNANAQAEKVYDETIDPMVQIDNAVSKAKKEGKHVVCQVGGNWCPWCLRFASFVKSDNAVAQTINDNYVYIHVNYPRGEGDSKALLERLGNPRRFGFPVIVVLDGDGHLIHTQDSSLLEEGKGYNAEKVLRFFKCWTPAALKEE